MSLISVELIQGGKGIDNRTIEQKRVLRELLGVLKQKYPDAVVQGH